VSRFMIMQDHWDYLIILDACRYDYFDRMWRAYVDQDADLSMITSVGSSTIEWRDNCFPQYYADVIYISANPYISSVHRVEGFLGSEHFAQVHDLWRDGWDVERGTVLPATVTAAAIDVARSNPASRLIIHYLQPHAPYLAFGTDCRGFPAPDVQSGHALEGVNKAREAPGAAAAAIKLLSAPLRRARVLGNRPDWRLREWLHLEPASPMDAVRRRYGKTGLRRAYAANLRLALQSVQLLLDHLAGRIIVTADHGELLGEGNCYSHWNGSDNPYLLDVPRLVVTSGNRPVRITGARREVEPTPRPRPGDKADANEEKRAIAERLRALGYME
jgi:hypothetical protein